jgi:hypothetical protein
MSEIGTIQLGKIQERQRRSRQKESGFLLRFA